MPSQAELKKKMETILREIERRHSTRAIQRFYPDDGPLSRAAYPKHVAFFEAGAKYRERLFLGGNRSGKSVTGAYEVALHLTGQYPKWWKGRRFSRPTAIWAAGDTGQTTRDVVQKKLLGEINALGTGMIPGDTIEDYKIKPGIPNAIETVYVKHVSGGTSSLGFKSYDQKRKAYQGTEKDVIWLDEEPPLDVYTECLLRTTKTEWFGGGMIISTFTPLEGMSQVVLSFLPGGLLPSGGYGETYDNGRSTEKFVVNVTWDDAPHLSAEEKEELWAAMPPYQREARTKGIPQLGAGAIFPIAEQDITVDDFPVLETYWPVAYALDVGWNWTAALWGAWDKQSDTIFIWSAYKRGVAEPPVHAAAIKARGTWIPGVIDPSGNNRNQKDGTRLMQEYINAGLNLRKAENPVEAGLLAVWNRMVTGRFKVFKSLLPFFEEFRLYRRNDKGRIVKENDHLMDCMRYLVLSGMKRAVSMPEYDSMVQQRYMPPMPPRMQGANPVTGY